MNSLPLAHSSSTLSPSAPFPPKPPFSPPPNLSRSRPPLERASISRRDIPLLLSLGVSLAPLPASAFDLGISGPKDWLKGQKRRTAKYLLAPIDASREILRSVFLLLTVKDSGNESKDFEEVRDMVRVAARDCIQEDRNSFVEFQAKTGVEVCTFKLVVKNASSLLDDKDPVKVEAETILSDLVRSFSTLNNMTSEADIQLLSNRQEVANAVMDVISSLDKFEQGIKNILEA